MAKTHGGLGRGLDAIFLDNAPNAEQNREDTVARISLSLIDPRAEQPRKQFDEESLRQLADSIVANGLFQPILVREANIGRYQIIAGERRYRACKLAGLTEIPAIVLDKDDEQTARIALIENVQRENLNPVEEAMAYRSLAEEYHMTQEALSTQVGKSRSAIANAVRLLDLPDDVLAMVAAGSLSAGHARTLLGLKNRDDMLLLAKKTVDFGYSVRQLETEVKRANKPQKEEVEAPAPIVDYLRELEVKLQTALGRKVKINGNGKHKSVSLYYEDNEDLDDLLLLLDREDFLGD